MSAPQQFSCLFCSYSLVGSCFDDSVIQKVQKTTNLIIFGKIFHILSKISGMVTENRAKNNMKYGCSPYISHGYGKHGKERVFEEQNLHGIAAV